MDRFDKACLVNSLRALVTIYRTRAIITLGLYIFYPIFEDHFFVFKDFKILSYCMVNIQESGLLWRTNGNEISPSPITWFFSKEFEKDLY